MSMDHLSGLDRRNFLRGAGLLGGAVALGVGLPSVLAACGSTTKTTADNLTLTAGADSNQLVGLFNYTGNYLVSGTPQRLPFTIATPDGPPARTGPAVLTFQLQKDGQAVGAPIEVLRHEDGTTIGYYPLTTTFDTIGTWSATTMLDGNESSQTFLVQSPSSVPLLQPGQTMPLVDTPTITDARGIDPICTRVPACDLHDRTLTDALARKAPIALLIGTPQFCQTGVCGPVLDLLLEQRAEFPSVQFLHAEVYKQPNGGGDPASRGLAPAVGAFGLSFEPSLFVANPNGVIATRLDNIFDRVEIRKALASVRS